MKGEILEKTKGLSLLLLYAVLEMGGEMFVAFLTGSRAATVQASRDIRRYTRPRIQSTLWKMQKRGFLEMKRRDGEIVVSLTDKGFHAVNRVQLRNKLLGQKTRKWDKLWRIVIFDIPDSQRTRRLFWRELKLLGFYGLQYSVYVYPHDCADIIEKLKYIFDVQDNVLVFTSSSLGHKEAEVRKFFRINLHL